MILLELMWNDLDRVVITFTFCCKSKFMALKKPGKRIFFTIPSLRNNEIETVNTSQYHLFHYLIGKHKTFNVTVAAKFSTYAKV